MTTKEKAKELVGRFRKVVFICEYEDDKDLNGFNDAKQCALICVDEILKVEGEKAWGCYNTITYWQQVKQEIEKL